MGEPADAGATDGDAAATAIALVFAMRMRPALLGAAILAGAGQHKSAGNNDFVAALAAKAGGPDWDKIAASVGHEKVAQARRDYLSAFQIALESGLDAPRDAGQMVRDLAPLASGAPDQPEPGGPVFAWIRELIALQARNLRRVWRQFRCRPAAAQPRCHRF